MSTARDVGHLPRDARRRRTEQQILDAARALFGETGFERTTIRGVAAAAGVDPALVMQYFGSKHGLFAAAARWPATADAVLAAGRAELPGAALADLFERFEGDGTDREGVVALLRNCLTHPEAARIMRDDVLCERVAAVTGALDGQDRELRAGLVSACLLGVAMTRHLLELPAVATADRADIERLMQPVLRLLVDPRPGSGSEPAPGKAPDRP